MVFENVKFYLTKSDFEKYKFLYYFLYTFIIVILSAIYTVIIIEKYNISTPNLNLRIEGLQFDYAKLVKNIVNKQEYVSLFDGVNLKMNRLPVFPSLLALLYLINKNIFFIVLSKNLLTFSIFYYAAYLFCKSNNKKNYFFITVLLAPIIIPYNMNVAFSIFFADSLTSILIPSIFLLLLSNNSNKYICIFVLIFILYLTKSSMLLICMFVSVVALFQNEKKIILKMIPLSGLLIAIFAWGTYGLIKTGKFPFGPSVLSTNSWVMTNVVLNKEFKRYYPDRSVDIIPRQVNRPKMLTEWEMYEFYKNRNKEYLKKNKKETINNMLTKIKFIFFYIKKDGLNEDINKKINNPIRYSSIVNKFFINVSVILSLFILLGGLTKLKIKPSIVKKFFLEFQTEIIFLGLLSSNLIPHVYGWAVTRHLVGISTISLLFFLILINKRYFNIN